MKYLYPIVIGTVAGTVMAILFVLFQSKRICPQCGKELPKFRIPMRNLKQFLLGGWICSNCGCKIDSRGKQINKA